MKPRLVSGWTHVWLGTVIPVHGWYCSGHGSSAFGVTPQGAYSAWIDSFRNAYPAGAYRAENEVRSAPGFWERLFGC